ncbi:MAG: DUF1275 domain-containing protein [Clostridiales bacterium]|nr:DUF1275 domain-containing protein [Clostridiales bacterium]
MGTHLEREIVYPAWERPGFLVIITLIGGYMNAYTYITRDGVLANMHTANMSHLGINLALGNWQIALSYFLPIASCIFGAAFSEAVKSQLSKSTLRGDWRKFALLLEAAALFAVGCMPLSLPNTLVTLFVSFFMGFQLCLFRTCLGVSHNTTICTGNIRNVGQKLYQVLTERSGQSLKTFLTFANLTFSFAVGAVPGILFSARYGGKAVWLCSGVLAALAWWIWRCEQKR